MTLLKLFSQILLLKGYLLLIPDAEACSIQTQVPGNWKILKTGTECDLAKKILYWKSLEGEAGTFEAIITFFLNNPSWPNQVALKRKAEESITPNVPKDAILKWFRKNTPVTAKGITSFMGHACSEKDQLILEEAFQNVVFSKKELTLFIQASRHLLKEKDYINRFDKLMKNDRLGEAEMMLPYIPKSYLSIAKDRLQLGRGHFVKRQATTLPGYLWQYCVYLIKTHEDTELLNVLKEKNVIAAEAQDPELWWTTIQRIVARRMLEEKRMNDAFMIVKDTKSTKGVEFAEAKWLEGWIKLRFLNRPKEALADFQNMYEKADTALRLSKAAYWAARAAKSANDKEAMGEWLEKASGHNASFYGQLAGDLLQKTFTKKEFVASKTGDQAFEELELVRVIRLLKKVNNAPLSELFFWKMAMNVSGPDEHEQLIKLASHVAGSHAAVQVTKIGAKQIMPIIEEAYPKIEKAHIPPLARMDGLNIEALVHAIIRQESLFKVDATSPKEAKGLMQLLDGTAAQMSKKEGIPYQNIYHPKSNIFLGAAYLRKLLNRYNGSLILAIAAYNAGPHRVDKWVVQYGYPRDPKGFEPIEWIQMIPFRETRHYVERVLENYWRYAISFDGVSIQNWNQRLF